MAKTKKPAQKNDKLQNALVLFHYVLNYFGCTDLEALSEGIKDPALETVDEDGVSRFYIALRDKLFLHDDAKAGEVLEYDHHIVRFTKEINENRREPIRWKYYQYLTLLFTEVYLDRYFRDKKAFAEDLNRFLHSDFNQRPGMWQGIPDFTEYSLNRLAFWQATGSGKTLEMHIHLKQFLYYAEKHGKRKEINNIILLTPNEGLSRQHLEELQRSGIGVEIFSKDRPNDVFSKGNVQIVEITRLDDNDGDKTVAVNNFEDHNLVLIDEAHKGSSGDVWLKYRNQLTANGFSFEYSATFGQAIGALGKKDKETMLRTYGQSTLFDYSYRYFYQDGYGKDYRIMNMKEWNEQDMLFEYLTAYLLCLYEQKLAFNEDRRISNEFLISNPLAVFVGGSVSVSKTDNAWNVSDVVLIILFLKDFIDRRNIYSHYIIDILNNNTSLTDNNGNAIFSNSFKKLKRDADFKTFQAEDGMKIYYGILKEVFHNASEGGVLHIDLLKGTDGEIGLRVGDNPYFSLIYVGDSSKVRSMCAEKGVLTTERTFGTKSLFASVTKEDSTVNILIGSKKFAEGWSCWRVSIMGLMNFGKSEGSMIIQMFGRGVRLKGYGMSLKRSSALDESIKPDKMPRDIKVMETLNIFGINANYMEEFKKYLTDEGLSPNDSDFIELTIKTIRECPKGLKIIRLDPTYDFKKSVKVHLKDYQGYVKVKLDWYPCIDVTESQKRSATTNDKDVQVLDKQHLRFIDWDEVFFAIEQFKNERSWYNLEIEAEELRPLMEENLTMQGKWYTLLAPQKSLRFKDFAKDKATWQEMTIALLKLYVEATYRKCQMKNMSEHQEVETLKPDYPNFISEYTVKISRSRKDWYKRLTDLKEAIGNGSFMAKDEDVDIEGNGKNVVTGLQFNRHLFNPIFFMNNEFAKKNNKQENSENLIHISPIALNDGERNLIVSLKGFLHNNDLKGKKVYILRNASKKGLGFFESEGFYPDFIMWVLDGEKQFLTFVDPKGIQHLKDQLDNEKVRLFKRLAEDIAPRLHDKDLILNSFIISDTSYNQLLYKGSYKPEDYEKNHVLFLEDRDYVKKLFEMIESTRSAES